VKIIIEQTLSFTSNKQAIPSSNSIKIPCVELEGGTIFPAKYYTCGAF